MIDQNADLFMRMADAYGIKVNPVERPDGLVEFDPQDKVSVHKAHLDLINARVGNLEKLIHKYQQKENVMLKDSIEKMEMKETIYKLKIQLLDLNVEAIAREYYEKNYQGRVQDSLEVEREQLIQFDKEMPELIIVGNHYVQANSRPYTRIAADIAGHLAQHAEGYKNNRTKIYTHQNLKRLINYANSVQSNQKPSP
jgi:hypothetical protein